MTEDKICQIKRNILLEVREIETEICDTYIEREQRKKDDKQREEKNKKKEMRNIEKERERQRGNLKKEKKD